MSSIRRKSTLNNNSKIDTSSSSGIAATNTSTTSNVAGSNGSKPLVVVAKDKTCRRMEQMEAEREERRRAMIERKKARNDEEQRNIAAGNPGDVDFIGMVRTWREEHSSNTKPYDRNDVKNNESSYYNHPRICISVRKRPITEKEIEKNDHDSVTCINPYVWVHSAKLKVDGISKYLDHTSYPFDFSFDETVSTESIYKYTTMPLLDFVCTGTNGRATVFAYGQTGSGKTYTMNGIQQMMSEDLFLLLSDSALDPDSNCCSIDNTSVTISFFEMYGGYVQDLLNNRNRLKVYEDGKGEIQITGLTEQVAYDPATFLQTIAAGNNLRTTHTTEANDTSSRSHSICQIMLKDRYNENKLRGKMSLVDLAGSERGTDTKSHNQQRRAESADINTSLLSLKECIRALDNNSNNRKAGTTGKTTGHVPYRGSKLTLILKDCFTSDNAMTSMIAAVSPGSLSADHSINTLRYAERIKSQQQHQQGQSFKIRARRQQRQRNVPSDSGTGVRETAVAEIAATTSHNHKNDRKSSSSNPRSTQQHHQPTQRRPHEQQQDEGRLLLEDEFRRTVEAILEQEEIILSTHMSNIQENAELLTVEGDLLNVIQQHYDIDGNNDNISNNMSSMALDEYATALEEILDRKEDMILNLQKHVNTFQIQLSKEKELSKLMNGKSLPQY